MLNLELLCTRNYAGTSRWMPSIFPISLPNQLKKLKIYCNIVHKKLQFFPEFKQYGFEKGNSIIFVESHSNPYQKCLISIAKKDELNFGFKLSGWNSTNKNRTDCSCANFFRTFDIPIDIDDDNQIESFYLFATKLWINNRLFFEIDFNTAEKVHNDN